MIESISRVDTVFIGVGLTLVMAAIYILNQIRDEATDRINRKLFLICDGHVSISKAYAEAFLFGPAGVILGFLADIRAGFLLTSLLFFGGYIYSYPPMRMKDRPIGGILINGLGGMVNFTLGWISAGGAGWIPLRSLVYFCGVAAVMLNTTMPDIKGDQKTGKITFAVKYGVRLTVVWALIIEIITVALACYFQEWIIFYPGFVMIPFFIYALSKKHVSDVIRATKYSVFSMAIAICVVFPLFLIPVFVIFFGSKWYYKKRFGFDYPNFKS
ncbi:UbiA family prenyltransferase [bacterium]|nr:UbiA family prenyltransferase [bacterium]